MNVQESKAFAAIRASRTPAEIAAFSAQLLTDSDQIVRYDWLKANLKTLPKPEAQLLYKKLEAEVQKYPGMVVMEDPLYGMPFYALRAKMGLFRGVKWDRDGKIRVDDAVRQENVRSLRAKLLEILGPNPDLSKDYGPKVKSILESIQYHEDVLAGKIKTTGSIWDRIVPKQEA